MNVNLNKSGDDTGLVVVVGGRGEGRGETAVLSKDIVVESPPISSAYMRAKPHTTAKTFQAFSPLSIAKTTNPVV